MPVPKAPEHREYTSIEAVRRTFLPNMGPTARVDFDVEEDLEKHHGTGLAVDLVKALRKELRPILK